MKKTMDGNTAAAYVSYAFTELAAIYPITPSSPMAEQVDQWSAEGRKNIFGNTVEVVEMQSEAGASAAVHGALRAGALTSTYTSSQGLLLMLPNMYEMASELLPAVFNVASRSIEGSALSIFGDHQDVMATRQTGFILLAEGSVQEVMDLSPVAHCTAIEASLPVMNFFDGFRTSHEIQKIEAIDYEDLKEMYPFDKLEAFRSRRLNPNHPQVTGAAQNADLHFQQVELTNPYYQQVPKIMRKYMQKINALRGTDYDIVNYYGDDQATEMIVAMGSVTQTIRQTVDYLNEQGRHVGLMEIHLYRPFPKEAFLEKMPQTVERVAVLDRTKEPGSDGEPLLLDVQSILYAQPRRIEVIGGRYGIASKDVTPNQMVAVFDELQKEITAMKRRFTVGINDDLTHLSLDAGEIMDLTHPDTFQAKFWGYGSDGTVGANKQAIKIIGNHTDLNAQGYFFYDSRKSGGLTISHLRFGEHPIRSTYLVQKANFVACHNMAYLRMYDMVKDLKEGGTFLLNTFWNEEEVIRLLPTKMKKELAQKKAKLYILNAVKIAGEEGLGRRINMIMQTGFFELAHILDRATYMNLLEESVEKAYGRKSQAIVDKNIAAIHRALDELVEVHYPVDEWANLEVVAEEKTDEPQFVREIMRPVEALEGDQISLKTMHENGMDDNHIMMGTSAYEKRGTALEVPQWDGEFCTQCNECAFACPHAAIRPFVVDEDELNQAPEGFIVRDMKGEDGLYYRIQVSLEDCTGCGLCVTSCPTKGKALKMVSYEEQKEQAINWAFAMTLKQKELKEPRRQTVQSTQLNQPLLEFSGACPGCGETPYVKLLTQMFGDRMIIANATGCSSIWGASSVVTPYTTNANGEGPAWSNSLLEDAAEYGFGMFKSNHLHRHQLAQRMMAVLEQGIGSKELQALMEDWIEHIDESEGTRQRATKLQAALEAEKDAHEELQSLLLASDLFVKPSQWMIGGDGWGYDIGFGGVDHVLASGADVNLLVLDNEVYANTGGQTSKATPAAAIAKFSANGKFEAKKDLAAIAMTYRNVYVAQIAAGANPMQVIKAFEEAEAYPGPSIIIAYVPCIAHGIVGGMGESIHEAKEAVESGYWSLFRYNPALREQGKSPMTLDFRRPDFNKITDYLMMQTRFSSLKRVNPAVADELYQKIQFNAKERFFSYARLAGMEEKLRAKLDPQASDKEDDKEKRQKEREERRRAREERRRQREEMK